MTIKSRLKVSRFMLIAMAVAVVGSVIYPVLFLSAATFDKAVPQPSVFDHIDFFKTVIGGMFVVVGWFFIRTVSKIDRNQSIIFDRLSAVCKQVDTLQGEHNARKEMCGK